MRTASIQKFDERSIIVLDTITAVGDCQILDFLILAERWNYLNGYLCWCLFGSGFMGYCELSRNCTKVRNSVEYL
jgi:hypothetical protein